MIIIKVPNNLSTQNTNVTNFNNCLISGKISKRDPLLEICNETFVTEQSKDSELSVIYHEILNNGSSKKFPNYFIHPDSKVLMLKKQNHIQNTFSYHIIVPHSL